MIIPIRCFTCNNIISHLWEDYIDEIQKKKIEETSEYPIKTRFVNTEQLEEKTIEGKILDKLKIKRYCCRRMFLSCVDLSEKI
jgi:DNA-directed RNA polymerase subunit N (RpoN/RPB10)